MTSVAAVPSEGHLSAHELQARTYAPLKYIVEGLIPTGLTILAGAPKARKSWLALDIALSVARGVACLDERRHSCPKGAVLYLALEDSERRLKDRIAQVLGQGPAWPANLFLETSWPRMDADGLPRLREWIEATPDARLIIIDVFQRFRAMSGGQAGYAKEYADLGRLQELAQQKEIGIVLVHHLRKSGGDPFDRMTGSTGLLGAPDTLIVLDKQRGGTRLLAQGKDIHELALEIVFDDLAKRWRPAQSRARVSAHPERDRILRMMTTAAQPLSSKDIASATGQSPDAVRQLLKKMVDAGEIDKIARGRYVDRSAAAMTPDLDHVDHNDHNDHDDREACLAELALRERNENRASEESGSHGTELAEDIELMNNALNDWISRSRPAIPDHRDT